MIRLVIVLVLVGVMTCAEYGRPDRPTTPVEKVPLDYWSESYYTIAWQ